MGLKGEGFLYKPQKKLKIVEQKVVRGEIKVETERPEMEREAMLDAWERRYRG